jgi:hypothetical protein
VDDALLSGTKETVEYIQGEIGKHFKCKFNAPKDFLGVNISTSTPGNTSLSMTTFTEKMMASHEVPLWTYKINTPGRTDVKIIRGVNPEPNEIYRSKVGSINWLVMALRYDLSYTVKELSRVLIEATREANTILERCLQYIKQTPHAQPTYNRQEMMKWKPPPTRKKPTDVKNTYDDVVNYNIQDTIKQPDEISSPQSYCHPGPQLILSCQTDIDLGGELESRQSTSGFTLYLNGVMVNFRGRTERLVLKSTAAGEYVALCRGNTASEFVIDVIQFYGYTQHTYHLYTDSQATEHIATQPTMNEHSRSIDIRHHSLRQDYLDNRMRIGGIKSKDNTADILTKFLQPDLHREHTRYLFPLGLPLTPRVHTTEHATHDSVEQDSTPETHSTNRLNHHHIHVTHVTRKKPREQTIPTNHSPYIPRETTPRARTMHILRIG